MHVKILVDSTADLNPAVRERISVLPLTIHFGDEEYLDGVTITGQEFYEKLVESDVMPTTSQASPYAFEEKFNELTTNGDQVVAITVSSKLSGTYQSAMIAAENFPGKVWVVDSASVAIGAGILAEHALNLADYGVSAAEIAEQLETVKSRIHVLAMLDTLEFLKRGGRISKAVALAGTMLSIKPVVSLDGGEITVRGKARGSRQANNLLVKEIQAAGGVDFSMPLMLGYTGLSDVLLKKYIEDSGDLWQNNCQELPYAMIGSVVGTHAGPGAVAVAFFAP